MVLTFRLDSDYYKLIFSLRRHDLRFAVTAIVAGCAAPDFIVACSAYIVPGTRTLIAVTLLSADRDAVKIIIPCYAGFGAECQHDLLPFGTVGPDPVCAIQNVYDVVRHLVGHSCCDTVIKVLGE